MDTGCIPPNCQLFSVHVSILKKADQLTLAYRLEHAGRISLGKKRSTWMIAKIAKGNRKNDYLRYPNSLTF